MRNNSLSGSDLFKGPPWSVMYLEAMLVNVVLAAASGRDEACGYTSSVLLTETLVMSLGFAALGWEGAC